MEEKFKAGDWVGVTIDSYQSHKRNLNNPFQVKSVTQGNRLHTELTGTGGWISASHCVHWIPKLEHLVLEIY